MRRIPVAASVLVTLLLATCSDPTAPAPEGSYVLVRLGQSPAPFVLSLDRFANGDSMLAELLADSVVFRGDGTLGRGQRRRGMVWNVGEQPLISESEFFINGQYVVRRDTVLVTYSISQMPNSPLGPAETLFVQNARTVVGTKLIGGACKAGATLECPTPPRPLTFQYDRR